MAAEAIEYPISKHDDTGLYFYRARYYSPTFHRFLSEDPIGLEGGDENFYAYTFNSPTNFTDPSGEAFFVPLIPALGACARGAAASIGLDKLSGRKIDFAQAAVDCLTGGAGKALSAAKAAVKGIKGNSKLKPGPFAKESVPGHPGKPTASEQRQLNDFMQKNGCNHCGTKDPGTKSGNAIGDHFPPQALGEPKDFFPSCLNCSHSQGGEVSGVIRGQ